MARAGLVASQRIAQGGHDTEFLRAKMPSAQFYADHVLTQAPALAETVVGSADAVLQYPESQF